MASDLYLPSSYRPDDELLTPTHAPGRLIVQEYMARARTQQESRRRALICREMRRNLLTCGVPEEWNDDERVRQVVEVVAPERQTMTMTMTNMLGAREPVWTRKAYGGTDTDKSDAEASEVFLNGARKQTFAWDEAVGKGTEDGEYGFIVLPRPALIEKRPSYMLEPGTPNPHYTRDSRGRGERDDGYTERSPRASMHAWRRDYEAMAAKHFPIAMRVIPMTDCVPIFARGWGRQTYTVRGLIIRSLMEVDELQAEGYTWDGMGNRAMIPRGYVTGRTTGQQGQLYKYELYTTHVTEDGECIPWCAVTVGGWQTANQRWSDTDQSAVINLKDEYGMCRPTWSYFYGLHSFDDDFDWRGIPLLWPVVRHILNKESLLTAYLAHTYDNAFTGHIAVPEQHIRPEAYLNSDLTFKKIEKPRSNELKYASGTPVPWPQATVSGDARYLLEEFRTVILREEEDTRRESADSGHAMVVGDQLMKQAKRQIPQGALECSEFAGEAIAELCCGLSRGEWRESQGRPVDIYVFEDVERTLESGETRSMREAVKFKDSWFGSNYSITARMPAEKNMAEVAQLQALYLDGLAKFSEVREALGDEHPETSFVEIQAYRWLTNNPIGMLTVDIEVAALRGMSDEEARLKAVLAKRLTEAGFPTAALAPEFQQQQPPQPMLGGAAGAPGQQVPGMAAPNMATNVLGGVLSGEMATASRQADAAAQMAVAPGQGPAGP